MKSSKRSTLTVHYNSPRTITGHLLNPSRHNKIKPRVPLSAGTVIYGHREIAGKMKKNTNESILKRSHDGAELVSVNIAILNGSGTCASKKRAFPQSSMCLPAKGPVGKCLNTNPLERDLLDVENSARWNSSFQALRLEKEWNDLSQCRSMKRNSQMIKHREDKMYMMSGLGIMLKPRYDVDDDELRVLKEFSRARKVSHDEYMKNSRTSSSRSHKQDHHNNNDRTQSSADTPGHWASERLKTPVQTTEHSKDGNSSSTFDKSLKDKDGEGKLKTHKEKSDNKRRETDNINDKVHINDNVSAKNSKVKQKNVDADSYDDGQSRKYDNGDASSHKDVIKDEDDDKIKEAET